MSGFIWKLVGHSWTKKLTNNLQIRGSREATPFFLLGRDICFNFGWQVKFRRGSNKKACRQAKKWAGSMKNAAKKILAPAAKKRKNMGRKL